MSMFYESAVLFADTKTCRLWRRVKYLSVLGGSRDIPLNPLSTYRFTELSNTKQMIPHLLAHCYLLWCIVVVSCVNSFFVKQWITSHLVFTSQRMWLSWCRDAVKKKKKGTDSSWDQVGRSLAPVWVCNSSIHPSIHQSLWHIFNVDCQSCVISHTLRCEIKLKCCLWFKESCKKKHQWESVQYTNSVYKGTSCLQYNYVSQSNSVVYDIRIWSLIDFKTTNRLCHECAAFCAAHASIT